MLCMRGLRSQRWRGCLRSECALKMVKGEFTMAISSGGIAPPGKRAVTFTTRTEIDSWFAYQSSEEDYEEWDQDALETFLE